MTYDLRLTTFAFLFCCALTSVSAQQKGEAGGDAYARSSISALVVNHSDSKYDSLVQVHFSSLNLGERYDINPLSQKTLDPDKVSAAGIEQRLNALDVGREIVSHWFNRKPSGEMDLSQIWRRGMYNATDEDYRTAVATKLGTDNLKDAGLQLIGHSYVVVLDYTNVRPHNLSLSCYLTGNVNVYLYALAYSSDLQDTILGCWVDKTTSPSEAAKKRQAFDSLHFVVKHLLTTSAKITTLNAQTRLLNAAKPKLWLSRLTPSARCRLENLDEELIKLIATGYRQAMQTVENNRKELMLTAPIVDRFPTIRAKIGKKEGMYPKQLFEVQEYYADTGGSVRAHTVAYARAVSIADNRSVTDGSTPTTTFSPIARTLPVNIRPGMNLLQAKHDKLFDLYADANIGIIANPTFKLFSVFNTGVEYLHRYPISGIAQRALMDVSLRMYGGALLFIGLRLGYSWGFNLTPNMNAQVYGMFGAGYAALSYDKTDGWETGYQKDGHFAGTLSVGASLSYNRYYPLTLFCKQELFIRPYPINFSMMGFGVKYAL